MPRLTEQEQQEIVRFIEADRPLPEKYRFLLFEDKREVELVWNGKTSEVCNIVLPFQVIEQVDEPRAEKPADTARQLSLFDLDARGRQLKGWTNKLIWGDNKLILSSLKNGPLREEIEKQGGLKLIYIDPPFDVGADFTMDIEIGGDTFTKKPNILEEIAYRDTWGKGADSFIAMIYERLVLMRDLLAEDGSIYVHCDWRVNAFIRLVMDEVFGIDNFINEITWKRTDAHSKAVKCKAYLARYMTQSSIRQICRSADTQHAVHAITPKTTASKWYRHVEEGTGRRYNKPILLDQAVPEWRIWFMIGTVSLVDIGDIAESEWSSLTRRSHCIFQQTGCPMSNAILTRCKGVRTQDLWDDIK